MTLPLRRLTPVEGMKLIYTKPFCGHSRIPVGRISAQFYKGLTKFSMAVGDEYYPGMDAYQILGVSRDADKKQIKAAYKKQIGTWHPDKFPDDEKKREEGGLRMQRINRAYYCLSDDDRRRRYDSYGEDGVGTSAASEEQLKGQGGPGMGGFGGMRGGAGGAVDVQDISDIFDAFFGGAAGGAGGGVGGARGSASRRRNANAPVAGTCSAPYPAVEYIVLASY